MSSQMLGRGHECSGDQCGFRMLYESSQSSLADMSARQGQALARVGRLRSGIALALRRNYPDLAARAEQQMGTRMSEVDDEILIAYLDAFSGAGTRPAPTDALGDIRRALNAAGVPVSGDDTASLVESIASLTRQRLDPPQESPGPVNGREEAARPATELSELFKEAGSRHEQYSGPPEAKAPLPVFERQVDLQPTRGGGSLALAEQDLAPQATAGTTSTPSTPLGSLFSDFSVELWDGPLGQVEEPDGRWSPSPIKAQSEVTNFGAAPAVPPAGGKLGKGRRKASTSSSREAAGHADGDSERETDDHVGGLTTAPAGDTPARSEDPIVEAAFDEINVDSLPLPPLHEAPLRPEIATTAGSARKRKGRTPRVQAEAPEDLKLYPAPASEPAAEQENREVSQGMLTALTAAASIPRPVFTRDLLEVAGDHETVDTWETTCRSDPANYPVRFIAPKMRHRARGSLVFSDLHPVSGADAWWQRCVTTYRGARLYELGVLLHRVGDEVVSSRFTEHTALLRLSTGKGLVGVVVVFDSQLERGDDSRESLKSAIEELLSERLVLVSALTTSGESGSLETLVSTLGDLALENGWAPAVPVVAARSWEYADDRGSTAVLALGG